MINAELQHLEISLGLEPKTEGGLLPKTLEYSNLSWRESTQRSQIGLGFGVLNYLPSLKPTLQRAFRNHSDPIMKVIQRLVYRV